MSLSSAQQGQGELRHIGDQQQDHQGSYYKRYDRLGDGLQVYVGYAAGHVQVHAHRRSHQADGQVHYHDGAEVHQVHAQGLGHRQEQRSEDVQGGGGIQEAAGYQQADVDDDKEDDGVAAGKGLQGGADGYVDAGTGKDIGKEGSGGGDEHDHGGGGCGVY